MSGTGKISGYKDSAGMISGILVVIAGLVALRSFVDFVWNPLNPRVEHRHIVI